MKIKRVNNSHFSEEPSDNLQRTVLKMIDEEEKKRLFSYEFCEIEPDFIAFLENYHDLSLRLPKDTTIIDIGCYQALQSVLFRNHIKYIGVEPSVPTEWRLQQNNTEYYSQTGQRFIQATLPELMKSGLDLQKTFVICSAVPDRNLQEMIQTVFPRYRISYPFEETKEKGV